MSLTVSLLALSVMATSAVAQSADDMDIVGAELPPVVVEGATLDVQTPPRRRVSKPTPPPAKVKAKSASTSKVKAKAVAKANPIASPASPAADAEPVTEIDADLDAAMVNATSTSSDADAATQAGGGVPADRIGSSVSVVTGAELQARQLRNAGDALRGLPGVAVSRSGGGAGLTQLRLRGGEANHTLVLIDGVEANDTFNGEFDFADLSTDDIERIEVIRGPQSGLYGSGAIGGVVNIVTRGGRGPLTFSAMSEAGSFGTVAGGLRVAGGTDQIWGSASITGRHSDGYNISRNGSEDDFSELKSLNIKAGAQILPGVLLDLSLRRTNKQGGRDTQAAFPDPSGIQVDDPANFAETSWLGAAQLRWTNFGGALSHLAKVTRNETERNDMSLFFGTPSNTSNLGERINYSYAATYHVDTRDIILARHYVTGLVEHADERFTPNSDFGFGFAADGVERSRGLNAGALEYRGEYADRLFVQGTVRRDDSDVFGGYTTWRTSASLRIPELGLRPHASYGTGLKLPSMFENFGTVPGAFYPNPDVGPERSKGWDAGVEFSVFDRLAIVDVTYFKQDLTDKIAVFANCRPAPPPFFSECSVVNEDGRSTREGIEVAGRFTLGAGLSLGLSYTYTDARDADGQLEIRKPQHSGRGDLTYRFDDGRGLVGVAARYTGINLDTNFGTFETVRLDPYWVVDVAASYKVAPGVEVFGRIENLFDANYQEVYGFETPGLAAYAGVRLTFEEPMTAHWAQYR